MKNINSLRDSKTGRFQTTTDTSTYKMVQFNHKRMSAHARDFCIAMNIPQIPKGFVVHHLDENKRNNDINNLALLTITAHNRIHAHEAWNKGLKQGDNKNFDNGIYKARLAREKTYFNKIKETYELHSQGLTTKEIKNKLGVGRGAITHRLKRYKELKNKYE